MPIVTETLLGLIRRQIASHGTVVWYDPERAYYDVAHQIQSQDVGGAAIHQYDPAHGFVWLRRELETLWAEALLPPKLLIYVPMARSDTQHALIEFEEGGVVMRPGQQPPEQNTALHVVARRALDAVFPAAKREEIVGEVEAGKLSLAELDQIADRGRQEDVGAIGVIFETGIPAEVALRFLASPDLDDEIESRQALESLSKLLTELLGVEFSVEQGPRGLRAQLARQILLTDLREALGEEIPSSFQTIALAERAVARQTAVDLARLWRNRQDLVDSYRQWAAQIQVEIGLSSMYLSLDALFRTETFLAAERMLQTKVERALEKQASTSLVEQARHRRQGFWSSQEPTVKTRWDVIVDAGDVLLGANRVRRVLKGTTWSADALLSRYAYGPDEDPWCRMDTAQRHLERDFHRFDLDPQVHDTLIRLVAKARHQYTEAANELAHTFLQAYSNANFTIAGVLLQSDVYKEAVAPAVQQERVAYLLVDALRFEMARELVEDLQATANEWDTHLVPALATPPTVTQVGMAALMPGAERGITIASDSRGLAPVLGDQPDRPLRTREDRVNKFQEAIDKGIVTTKLRDLAPLRDHKLTRSIEEAHIVLVTAADEIDGLCESNPSLARRMLDDVFDQIRRGLKSLFDHGIKTAIITADHGYLFGEKLTPGQGIDSPGGQTIALKRRVWIGQGGAQSKSYLRRPLSAFGIGGDLEIATPWNLSCFKVPGGATEYFHGGLSLPEVVIPVLTVKSGVGGVEAPGAEINWKLTLGRETISTRFFSVTIEGSATQLLPLDPPLIRVEIRTGDQPISVPVSASSGFQDTTTDVQLKCQEDNETTVAKNTVTLMITEEPSVERVDVYLLDATTGMTLARREDIPFEITL